MREDFDELSKQTGPKGDIGKQGPKGLVGLSGEKGFKGETGSTGLKGADGRDGVSGKDGKDVDQEQLKLLVMQWLNSAQFEVIFEAGDEDIEPERRVFVKFNGGELRIPPSVMSFRNVNRKGEQVGSILFDKAPLGMPLKLRFRPPVEAKQ